MIGKLLLLCGIIAVTQAFYLPAPQNSQAYNPNLLSMVPVNGKNYFFSFQQTMSWIEAMNYCLAFGLDLASIEDLSENLAISEYMQDHMVSDAFISGNTIGRASTWLWLTGKPMFFENWALSEPNNSGNCMSVGGIQGNWYDTDCLSRKPFICEERGDTSSSTLPSNTI